MIFNRKAWLSCSVRVALFMALYCRIVLLVKFTLFVAFLIFMSAIYLVNKDY